MTSSADATPIPELELNGKKEDLENGSEVVKKDTGVDRKGQIVSAIGNFGKWQLQKCVFICFIIWLPASFHLLNMVFFR